ncbi:pentatricopeptide repeat-containing protein, mitochondrial [Fagus crenata]
MPGRLVVEEVEALAMQRAVLFVQEIGLSEVVFEGDSSIFIAALYEDRENLSPLGHIVEDIKDLTSSFQFCQWSHTKRVNNEATHLLDFSAIHLDSYRVSLEEILDPIVSVVLRDISVS